MSATRGDNRTGVLSVKKGHPDPRTLPAQPSWQQPRPQVTLSELIPGQYVSTIARIAYVKTSERTDALGTKIIFTGVLEDSTFKAPFVSHRISYPLIRNSIYKFNSAYVHEFEDKSVLLIVTEHTKIEPKNVDDYREFVWTPRIESLKRPIHHVALQGVITSPHPSRITIGIVPNLAMSTHHTITHIPTTLSYRYDNTRQKTFSRQHPHFPKVSIILGILVSISSVLMGDSF